MILRSLFTKSLPAALLLTFIFTTAVAQSPILPFPVQAPVQLSAQPFLQQNQVIVGPSSVIQVPQRAYVAPVLQTPTYTAPIAAPVQSAPLQSVVSEHEILNMDLRIEMAYHNRIQRHVQTNRDINSFVSMMSQNLATSGWSTSWQGYNNTSGAYVTDLYHTGGQHLRLEVENASTGGYQVLLYTF